ncbi:MAG: hypothetical protein K2X77_05425 [Candidatus Obscuribacterales bacterium]|jgi:hypothetical protein|nr:hypothetical protein [Candidatus Obscuribacterales bacterium]
MSKAGGSGSFNHGDNAIDFQRSSDATEKSDQTSSRFRQSLSDTDRREHQDRENRVKEIRANKTAPTTAGRIIGGTPEIGHHVGHSKVYLEKNQVSVVEDPRLGEVWQRTSDGKIKIERKDPGTGEESHIEVKGRLSVEKSGDQVTAFKADIQFQNGREVSYRNGEPIEIKHPDGEVWRRDAKDKSVWHVSAHDQNHPGRTAHFDIDNVQVDSQTGDIHWHVIGGEGQGHIRRIDRYGQYNDFAPGQRITFVNETPRHQQAQDDSSHPGAAQQAPFDKPLNRSEQKHQEANDAYLSIKPKPRSESQNEQRESLTSQNAIAEKPDVKNTQQLIDPETGELHIGKHGYRPEQVYAQILNNVSDAREQTAPRCQRYDGDSVALLGSRCYIQRADGSVDKFDNNKNYLGTAIDASGKTFHNKGAFSLNAINPAGDINQLAGVFVKFANPYNHQQKPVPQSDKPSPESYKVPNAELTPIKVTDANYAKPSEPQAEKMIKLPQPSDQSNSKSAKQAGESIRTGNITAGVSEINKHLREIEHSGATPEQKKQAEWSYLQQACNEAGISPTVQGDFWIHSKSKDHTIQLTGTSLGDYFSGQDLQDRCKLVPARQLQKPEQGVQDTSNAKLPYVEGQLLQGNAQQSQNLAPTYSLEAQKYNPAYADQMNRYKLEAQTNLDSSKQSSQEAQIERVAWKEWNNRIQEHIQLAMTQYIKEYHSNKAGSVTIDFEVSRTGYITGVSAQGHPRSVALEETCKNVVNTISGTELLKFPQRSQKQKQHFSWALNYGNIREGVNYQNGQDEFIRR